MLMTLQNGLHYHGGSLRFGQLMESPWPECRLPPLPLPGPQLLLCWALQTRPHASQLWANLLSGLEESGIWAGIRTPRDMDLCGGHRLFPNPCPSVMGHWTLAMDL